MLVISARAGDFVWRAAGAVALATAPDDRAKVVCLETEPTAVLTRPLTDPYDQDRPAAARIALRARVLTQAIGYEVPGRTDFLGSRLRRDNDLAVHGWTVQRAHHRRRPNRPPRRRRPRRRRQHHVRPRDDIDHALESAQARVDKEHTSREAFSSG